MQNQILTKRDYWRACGFRLRRLIDALGISYAQAATDMGVSPSNLGNWLRGSACPTPYELYRFSAINGVDCNWVYLGDPSRLPRALADRALGLSQPQVGQEVSAAPAHEKTSA
jgi:transcriptional regulator with XRE-family HTH domain